MSRIAPTGVGGTKIARKPCCFRDDTGAEPQPRPISTGCVSSRSIPGRELPVQPGDISACRTLVVPSRKIIEASSFPDTGGVKGEKQTMTESRVACREWCLVLEERSDLSAW